MRPCAIGRASASAGPPGVNGTIMRIGFVGYGRLRGRMIGRRRGPAAGKRSRPVFGSSSANRWRWVYCGLIPALRASSPIRVISRVDEPVELGRRAGRRLRRRARRSALNVGHLERRQDLAVQLVDDRARRPRRREHAGPRFPEETGQAGLGDRRRIGISRRARSCPSRRARGACRPSPACPASKAAT